MSAIWNRYARPVTHEEYAILVVIGLLVGLISPAPIIMRLKRRPVQDTLNGTYGVLNVFLSFGLVPGAITALFDFAKVEVVMLATFVIFHWNVDAAILAGCAVVSGHLLPALVRRDGDTGSFPYLGLSLMLLQFPGVWLLVAAIFLSGSINCVIAFMLTFVVATPIFAVFYGYSSSCLVAIAVTSVLMICVRTRSFKRLVIKTEPTIVDILSQLHALVVKRLD